MKNIERGYAMASKKYLSCFLCIVFVFLSVSLKAAPTDDSASSKALDIGAEAAILMDASTHTVLYEKNATEKLYPASITKLMTALLAIENLKPDQTITFSKEAVNSIEPGSNHLWMIEGEQITVDQALHGLLLESANEVANGLGEAVSGSIKGFAELMTKRAKELGALNTNFVNPHGLHDANHYTTAYDMALIASYLTHVDYFLDIMKDTSYQIPATNKNELRYLAQQHPMINPVKNPSLFREDVIGGKTGYTNEARQTLVTMAKRGDTTLVAVVLKAEKNTVYTDTNALLDYGFNSFKNQTLYTTDEIVKTLPMYSVQSGQPFISAYCGLSLTEDANLLLNQNINKEDIVLSFNLPDTLNENLQVGDIVGSVDFILNLKKLRTLELKVSKIDPQEKPLLPSTTQTFSKFLIGSIIVTVLAFLLFFIILIKRKANRRNRRKLRRLFK